MRARDTARRALLDRDGARAVIAYDQTRDANVGAIVAPRDRWPNKRVAARYDVMSDVGDERPAIVERRASDLIVCRRKACGDAPGDTHCVHTKAVRDWLEQDRAAALDGRDDALAHGLRCQDAGGPRP